MKIAQHFFRYTSILVFIVGTISLSGCNSSQAQSASIVRISNEEFDALKASKEIQIVDVRTPNEFKQGYIEGAQLMDYMQGDFKHKVDQLDKSKPIVVYCAVGGRSYQSTAVLKQLGFTEIYDLKKGIRGWLADGRPTIK